METEEKRTQAIEEILLNEEYLKKIYAAQNDEEIRNIFREKDVELDNKQMESLKLIFKETLKKAKEALNDQELNQISGGVNAEQIKESTISGTGIGGAIGLGIGTVVGGMYGIIDTGVKAKADDGFIKNFSKILYKTATAAAMTGATGAGIGAGIGAGVGLAGGLPLAEK